MILFFFFKHNLKTFLKCNLLCNEMNNMLTNRGVGNAVHEFHFSGKSLFECPAGNTPLKSCKHLVGMQFVGNKNNTNTNSF